jgi:hypothetical protein
MLTAVRCGTVVPPALVRVPRVSSVYPEKGEVAFFGRGDGNANGTDHRRCTDHSRREKVIDIGPLEATTKQKNTIALPPVVGAMVASGILLVIFGGRRRA